MSAPTLSYAIKELESILKVELFDRSRKGMALTSEGLKLKVFCSRFFSEMSTLTHELSNPEFKLRRKIKVGIFPTIAIYFWPLVHQHFEEDQETSISLQTNRSHLLVESLIRKEIDVAVTVESAAFDRIIRHELYKDEYAFYFSATKLQTSRDFSKEVLLFIPDAKDESGKTLRQYCSGANLKFKDEFELDSLEVIAEFVKKGHGIGILPTRVAKPLIGQIKMIRPTPALPSQFGTHKFFLSHRDDLDLPQKLIDKLINSAKKAVRQMNDAKNN